VLKFIDTTKLNQYSYFVDISGSDKDRNVNKVRKLVVFRLLIMELFNVFIMVSLYGPLSLVKWRLTMFMID